MEQQEQHGTAFSVKKKYPVPLVFDEFG